MDRNNQSIPRRRPRQQLTCMQCSRHKVKCDHGRPCKRCRIRGWGNKCTYPSDILARIRDSATVLTGSRRAERDPELPSASPPIVNQLPRTNLLPYLVSADGLPRGITETTIPGSFSANIDTAYGSLSTRSCYSGALQRTLSEPNRSAMVMPNSFSTLDRLPSNASTYPIEKYQEQNRSRSTQDDRQEPKDSSKSALYGNDGESTYFGRSSASWLISKFGNIMEYCRVQDDMNDNDRLSSMRTKRFTSQHLMAKDQEEISLSGLSAEVPTREASDLLVTSYLKTFESVYPLFDIRIFWREYECFWEAPNQARLVFVIILLLVICMGNSTMPYTQRPIPRSKVLKWWHLGLTWQSSAAESNERMISTLQASCLVVNLWQVYSFSEIAEWMSSGSLMKCALAMGLHRDPSKLRDIPLEDYELRRKIFYTVLEIDLQLCLNSGMPPTIRLGDWDTPPPEAASQTLSCHADQPSGTSYNRSQIPVSTHTPMLNSINVRMEIACFANAVVPESNYDKILDLTDQLKEAFYGLETEPQSYQTQMLKSVYNRYILILHVPFALASDPKFAFSESICLTCALSILEQMTPPIMDVSHSDQPDMVGASSAHQCSINHADNICIASIHASGAIFENTGLYAALYLCHELIQDDYVPLAPSSSSHDGTYYAESLSSTRYGTNGRCANSNLLLTLPTIEVSVVSLIERFIKVAEESLRMTQFTKKALLILRMALAYHHISKNPEVQMAEEKERRLIEVGRMIAENCFNTFCRYPDDARVS